MTKLTALLDDLEDYVSDLEGSYHLTTAEVITNLRELIAKHRPAK